MKPAVAMVVLLGGCLRATQFVCDDNNDCGNDGFCEASGFCSFADGACEGGRRYGQESGDVSGQCVPPGITPRCANDYAPVNGSPHVYKMLGVSDDWNRQRDRCNNDDNAFLAIPDDAGELSLILDLAGDDVWIGIDDKSTEGNYVTVLGASATFLPWESGEPDNSQNSDCVRISVSSRQLRDDRCSSKFRAVCECVP